MQPWRDGQPRWLGGRGALQQCVLRDQTGSGTDFHYADGCPPAWLEFAANQNDTTNMLGEAAINTRLCFPLEFFYWCQRYLNQALVSEPPAGASAECRVLWTIDVWSKVSYALFALNLNWSTLAEGVVDLRRAQDRWAMAFVDVVGAYVVDANTVGTNLFRAFTTIASARVAQMRSVYGADSRLSEPLFASLPIFWVGQSGRDYAPNPLWATLIDTIQPWSTDWSNNYLVSWGNRDASDIQRYAQDAPLLLAAYQWRLLCARDLVLQEAGTPLLSQYIASADGAVPAHGWSMTYVREYARLVLGLDYAGELARAVAYHIKSFGPRVNADATPMTNDQWRASIGQAPDPNRERAAELAKQYLTYVDWKDLWRGTVKYVTARLQAAVTKPPTKADCNGDKFCEQAITTLGESYAASMTLNPFGAGLASFLVKTFGAALGAGWNPGYVLPAPVARTLSTPGWSLAPNGSTADVWYRWGLAWAAYGTLAPGILDTNRSSAPTPSTPTPSTPTTYDHSGDVVLPTQATARANASPELQSYCLGLAGQWLNDHPEYKGCITAADLPVWNQICYAIGLKQITFEAGAAMWGQYVVNMKKCGLRPRSTGTLWAALKQGVERGTNPLQQSSSSPTFAARVFVPINPFRAFGKAV